MTTMTMTPRCLSPDCQMGGLGCDNMTCVLVCLLHQQPYQVARHQDGRNLITRSWNELKQKSPKLLKAAGC